MPYMSACKKEQRGAGRAVTHTVSRNPILLLVGGGAGLLQQACHGPPYSPRSTQSMSSCWEWTPSLA